MVGESKLGILSPARLARFGLLLSAAGIATLHLLPRPVVAATTGQVVLYDPPLNFLSEYVRTQYGPLMTFNFWALAGAAVAAVWALRAAGLGREASAPPKKGQGARARRARTARLRRGTRSPNRRLRRSGRASSRLRHFRPQLRLRRRAQACQEPRSCVPCRCLRRDREPWP